DDQCRGARRGVVRATGRCASLDAAVRPRPGRRAWPGDLLHRGPGARPGDVRVAVGVHPGGRVPGGHGRAAPGRLAARGDRDLDRGRAGDAGRDRLRGRRRLAGRPRPHPSGAAARGGLTAGDHAGWPWGAWQTTLLVVPPAGKRLKLPRRPGTGGSVREREGTGWAMSEWLGLTV